MVFEALNCRETNLPLFFSLRNDTMSLAEREQQIYAKISKKLLDTGEKERYVLVVGMRSEILLQ